MFPFILCAAVPNRGGFAPGGFERLDLNERFASAGHDDGLAFGSNPLADLGKLGLGFEKSDCVHRYNILVDWLIGKSGLY